MCTPKGTQVVAHAGEDSTCNKDKNSGLFDMCVIARWIKHSYRCLIVNLKRQERRALHSGLRLCWHTRDTRWHGGCQKLIIVCTKPQA